MNLTALSHYDGDMDTRFGDCIMLNDSTSLIVYDCGHTRHAEEVESFLKSHSFINSVDIVVSHNDDDHTNGISSLLDYLFVEKYTSVTVYTSLYLKSAKKVLELLDGRHTLPATKHHILETFDKIKEIVETAQGYSFIVKDAIVNTTVSSAVATIVGPAEEDFLEVVAQAISNNSVTKIEGETVMNAASIQLKCELDNGDNLLLCGDASPVTGHC